MKKLGRKPIPNKEDVRQRIVGLRMTGRMYEEIKEMAEAKEFSGPSEMIRVCVAKEIAAFRRATQSD